MHFFCVENVPNSRNIQLQEEGKIGCLFTGRNHLAHSRQFQRRKEKSRSAENVARFASANFTMFYCSSSSMGVSRLSIFLLLRGLVFAATEGSIIQVSS